MSFNPSSAGMFRQSSLHQNSRMQGSTSGGAVGSDPKKAQRHSALGSLSLIRKKENNVKAPTLSDPHNELVTINVGKAENMMVYKVYKQFATHYSPVLSATFKRGFLEETTQEITMDDIEDPRTFGTIQAWMYSQESDDGLNSLVDLECDQLINTWILADRLLMPKLQNAIIRRLMWNSLSNEQVLDANRIYDSTVTGSALRKWFVDKCAFEVDEKVWLKAAERVDTPRQFAIDLALAFKSDSKTSSEPFHIFPGKSPMVAESYYVTE